jgi:preprotein translocase subunit YajC
MGGSFMGTGNIISIVVLFAVFYFVLIMPERKRQKKMKEMLDNLKVGSSVITRGGIVGEIINIDGDQLVIVTGPNRVKIEITRHAVGNVIEAASNKIEEKSKDNNAEEK